jgi:hypothetical protein
MEDGGWKMEGAAAPGKLKRKKGIDNRETRQKREMNLTQRSQRPRREAGKREAFSHRWAQTGTDKKTVLNLFFLICARLCSSVAKILPSSCVGTTPPLAVPSSP